MKVRTTLPACLGLILLVAGIASAEVELAPVEFSGFADILWHLDAGPDGGDSFAIGQAEVDLATSVGDKINLEMALAYDPDAGTFGLGALVMELSLIGASDNHFHHSDFIENAGLVIGQMDVPFGIDWMFYPSIDRQFITGPLAVAGTHDGWNDLGVAAYVETARMNGIVYHLNGTGYEAPFLPDDVVGGPTDGAWGARLGIAVLAGVELGGSWAGILTTEGDQTSSLWGLDAQWAGGPYSAKGEYIQQRVGQDAVRTLEHHGSYFEGMYRPDKFFLLARYGEFRPDGEEFATETRICLGVGRTIEAGAEVRLEHQVGLKALPNRTVAQFVIGF